MSSWRFPRSTAQWASGIEVERPGEVSPAIVRLATKTLWPLVRALFRPRLEGVANLPDVGPYLLVANHSAGTGLAEIVCFAALYLRRVGPHRPLAGYALPQGFHVFPLSCLLRSVGAIPSTYEAAGRTLAAGVPILVFPGGDHEALRPLWKAAQVDFGDRVGFLRIARAAGVPIVPMGIRGAHWTCPILARSKWLARLLVVPRLLGIKRWGLSLPGLVVATALLAWVPLALPWRLLLVWAWLGSPFVFLPCIPWSIRFRIGRPIQVPEASPSACDSDLADSLAEVERAVEALVRAPG
jgi:1-acyl-sn-glycerol-3-phosphate acyltransferase